MSIREFVKKHAHIRKKNQNRPTSTDDIDRITSPAKYDGAIEQARSNQEFRIIRSDTHNISTVEVPDIQPPSEGNRSNLLATPSPRESRLSKLGVRRRSKSPASESLPEFDDIDESDPNAENKWEQHATKLAKVRPLSIQGSKEDLSNLEKLSCNSEEEIIGESGRSISNGWEPGSPEDEDKYMQEAIDLHQAGEFEAATAQFRKMADQPGNSHNRVFAQLLYGLALRHGWGCEVDTKKALVYLSAAAENAGRVEERAINSGITKGGKFKGELTLAIYELGNCYRNGWGVEKDTKMALHYFETAAHLGDADGANEAAWHYMNGIGTKRNKKAAAKYYRIAEKAGSKIVGNSWIWKDKYD